MKYVQLFEDFSGAPRYWEDFVTRLDSTDPDDRIKYNGKDELNYEGNMIDFFVKKDPNSKISYGFVLKDGYRTNDLLKSINNCHIAAFHKNMFALDRELKNKLKVDSKEFTMPGMDLMSLKREGYKLFNEILTIDQMPPNQQAFKLEPGERDEFVMTDIDLDTPR